MRSNCLRSDSIYNLETTYLKDGNESYVVVEKVRKISMKEALFSRELLVQVLERRTELHFQHY